MKTKYFWLLLGLLGLPLNAQDASVLRAAMWLSGAASLEEIPADYVERLENARVVRVNSSTLRAGDVLTDYQVACILDYRSRYGDILSFEELALVDGFSAEAVAALRPFLSLETFGPVTDPVRASVLARGTLSTFGMKGQVSGPGFRAGGAFRSKAGSFYLEGEYRHLRVLGGYFHARWGQGLASWTGFSMSSLSSLDAFVRRSTGLSPVWSYAPSSVYKGVAAEYSLSHWRFSGFAGSSYGFHTDYMWRSGQVGVSWLPGRVALDGRLNVRGVDYVGEVAVGGRAVACKASARGRNWAFQGRFIPNKFSGKKNGEYALAGGWSFKGDRWVSLAGKEGFGSSVPFMQASLTAEGSYIPVAADRRRYQVRVYGLWQWQMSPVFLLDVRFTERYRNYEPPRTDFRADVSAGSGPWLGVLRLEADYCSSWGCLGYLEGGYKASSASLFLRVTGFSISSWAARIYCYERDAAGTFSVPAYNGRGIAASFVGSCKARIFRRFTLRGTLRAAAQWRIGYAPAYTLNAQLQCDL